MARIVKGIRQAGPGLRPLIPPARARVVHHPEQFEVEDDAAAHKKLRELRACERRKGWGWYVDDASK